MTPVQAALELIQKHKLPEFAILAIDGFSGAGKSTLGAALAAHTGANLLHMDDFFVPMAQKTEERLQMPGGNVDWERFLAEVLIPIKKGMPFSYRPFDCQSQSYKETVTIAPMPLNIVEGSYSHHPALRGYMDRTVFMDLTPLEQVNRILQRNGEAQLQRFVNEWIPLENAYFRAFQIKEQADLVI